MNSHKHYESINCRTQEKSQPISSCIVKDYHDYQLSLETGSTDQIQLKKF